MSPMNDATSPDLAGAPSYRVLARKIPPVELPDLIGQDAMVRTISNAFETGRIPQAWILTGVRGVGKTTTARILSRAERYEWPTVRSKGRPSHDSGARAALPGDHGEPARRRDRDGCRLAQRRRRCARSTRRCAIPGVGALQGLHPRRSAHALDLGVQRAAQDAGGAAAAREVRVRHDRIRRVPITILSRCQRFDLRRVDAALLVRHLEAIYAKEGIAAEPEALALIARAAEGSVARRALADGRASRMRPAACAPRTCGRCSASRTARVSSSCSRR